MKTQILQLEPHDDVISARDKMGWSQTSRVLLVWPNRERILTRRLDLELLMRHSRSLGAQLALVTLDRDVRYHANQLGIHVFKNVKKAQNTRWKRPNHRHINRLRGPILDRESIPSPPGLSADLIPLSIPARLALFTLGVLALLSIVAVLLPRAEIQLEPKTQAQEVTIPVQASLSVERVNLSGLVPIQSVGVVVEGRDSLEPTGSIQVPENRAKGHVIFTNLTAHVVSVPANTVVSTPGSRLRFTTDRTGRVPAGAGETLNLPVTALAPGSRFNLQSGRIKAIEGPLGLSLTVTNSRPTRGGTDHTSLAPSPLDRSRLANQLLGTLRESARSEIQTLLEPGDLVLAPTAALAQTLEEVYDPPDFQPANLLSLTLRVEFQFLTVSGEDLHRLGQAALDANLPGGFAPRSMEINIDHKTEPIIEAGSTARWELTASRVIQAQVRKEQATSLSLGLSPGQASQRLLDGLSIGSAPDILLTPPWWPRLPFLPFRINVSTVNND